MNEIYLRGLDFSDSISGINNKLYYCWGYSNSKYFEKNEITDENFVCVVCFLYPNESEVIVRNYVYVGFHKTIKEFLSVISNRNNNLINGIFFFIPSSLEESEEIIQDIKIRHNL